MTANALKRFKIVYFSMWMGDASTKCKHNPTDLHQLGKLFGLFFPSNIHNNLGQSDHIGNTVQQPLCTNQLANMLEVMCIKHQDVTRVHHLNYFKDLFLPVDSVAKLCAQETQ